MDIQRISRSYFAAPNDLTARSSSIKTRSLAALKVLSYLTLLPLIILGITYCITKSLAHRKVAPASNNSVKKVAENALPLADAARKLELQGAPTAKVESDEATGQPISDAKKRAEAEKKQTEEAQKLEQEKKAKEAEEAQKLEQDRKIKEAEERVRKETEERVRKEIEDKAAKPLAFDQLKTLTKLDSEADLQIALSALKENQEKAFERVLNVLVSPTLALNDYEAYKRLKKFMVEALSLKKDGNWLYYPSLLNNLFSHLKKNSHGISLGENVALELMQKKLNHFTLDEIFKCWNLQTFRGGPNYKAGAISWVTEDPTKCEERMEEIYKRLENEYIAHMEYAEIAAHAYVKTSTRIKSSYHNTRLNKPYELIEFVNREIGKLKD